MKLKKISEFTEEVKLPIEAKFGVYTAFVYYKNY
jgi:hypothetical protein